MKVPEVLVHEVHTTCLGQPPFSVRLDELHHCCGIFRCFAWLSITCRKIQLCFVFKHPCTSRMVTILFWHYTFLLPVILSRLSGFEIHSRIMGKRKSMAEQCERPEAKDKFRYGFKHFLLAEYVLMHVSKCHENQSLQWQAQSCYLHIPLSQRNLFSLLVN